MSGDDGPLSDFQGDFQDEDSQHQEDDGGIMMDDMMDNNMSNMEMDGMLDHEQGGGLLPEDGFEVNPFGADENNLIADNTPASSTTHTNGNSNNN